MSSGSAKYALRPGNRLESTGSFGIRAPAARAASMVRSTSSRSSTLMASEKPRIPAPGATFSGLWESFAELVQVEDAEQRAAQLEAHHVARVDHHLEAEPPVEGGEALHVARAERDEGEAGGNGHRILLVGVLNGA